MSFSNKKTRDDKWVTDRIKKARIATFIGFMLMGAMLYVWSTGVSSFRTKVGLVDAQGDIAFGMITLGLGAGGAIGCFIIGKFIDKWGAKKVVGATTILYPLSIIPLGYVDGFYFALIFASLYGFFRGTIDTALNTHGVQVERFYQRSIMSAFHAFFSFGGFIAGMICSWLIGFNPEDPAFTFTVMGLGLFVVGLFITHWMLDKDDVPPDTDSQNFMVASATRTHQQMQPKKVVILMVGFGVVLLAGMVSEGAVWDWGQEFVRRELDASVSLAGVAVSVFIGAECFGRLVGDRLAEKLGAPQMVFWSGVTSVIGLLLVSIGNSAFIGIIGLALTGLGLACITPLMLSSAGRKDTENAGRNIGIVNCIGYTGMLVGPITITAVVGYFSLSWLMLFPAALMALLTIFGPMLMSDRKTKEMKRFTQVKKEC
ncbi:MFS transporter [Pectobacterium sp. A5351]|uniref:MFS transporter n=1 Tax=Pectobacterium sp. A5351 TaxID=2914983 RepID=UPI00232AEE15|nr:MFS transporter [Pectobacterium sp. A5351]WCG84658.1 MFS transporter [Pectobacterium sp. A5351]